MDHLQFGAQTSSKGKPVILLVLEMDSSFSNIALFLSTRPPQTDSSIYGAACLRAAGFKSTVWRCAAES